MKMAIICFDFKESNLQKQPWRYIYEIAKGLQAEGHEVFVITDAKEGRNVKGVRVVSVNKLFTPFKGETREVIEILEEEKPDKVIMLLGLTSFLRTCFKIKQPVIGIFTSPVYSLRELIKNIGIKDLISYRKYTLIHIINSLVPSFFIRRWSQKFEYIIVLSQHSRDRLIKKGAPADKVIVILPGIDEEFLEPPKREKIEYIRHEISPEGIPIVMYYTSPLTLRGTDTIIRALPYILEEKKVKVLILSRPDDSSLIREEEKLKKIAKTLGVEKNVIIVSKYLSPEDVKAYVSSADIVALPFKLVISDSPLSVLEAMALGKVVIGTDVDGIPELLKGNGVVIQPNQPEELASAVLSLLDDMNKLETIGNQARRYVLSWNRWKDVVNDIQKLLGGKI